MCAVTVLPEPGRVWPASAVGRGRSTGFTLIEIAVTLVILGVLIAVGVPAMRPMFQSARLSSMEDFYLEGMRMARSGAIQKSAAARFVMTPNANGQFDWQVDWCFPTTVSPCVAGGAWSTTAAAAAGDPNTTSPSLSVFRSASSLPDASQVTISLTPVNATAIYFNAYGWMNTNVPSNLTLLCMDTDGSCLAAPGTPPPVLPRAIAITLSGVAERCNPLAAATDSRACTP